MANAKQTSRRVATLAARTLANPKASNCMRRAPRAGRRYRQMPKAARAPTGMLMKKTHRQL